MLARLFQVLSRSSTMRGVARVFWVVARVLLHGWPNVLVGF